MNVYVKFYNNKGLLEVKCLKKVYTPLINVHYTPIFQERLG